MDTRAQFEQILREQARQRGARAAERVSIDQRVAAPKMTGNMAATTTVAREGGVSSVLAWRLISRTPYAQFQDQGTGVHGPFRRRIVAAEVGNRKRAFRMPLASGVVFRASHEGTPATRFFSGPLDRWPRYLQEEFR